VNTPIPDTLLLVVGIIIAGISSLIPCFIGYHMVYHYKRFSWMIITIVILFLWGLRAKVGFDINAQKSIEDTGKSLSSDILSFSGNVFGSFTSVHVITLAFCININF